MKKLIYLAAVVIAIGCQPKTTSTTTTNTTVSSDDNTEINTAANATYMSVREREMIKEINLLRSNPRSYVAEVEKYIAELEESKKNLISGEEYVNAEIKTAKDLVKDLKKMSPLSILQPHRELYDAAKNHGIYMRKSGNFDHTGKGGSSPWDRILDGKNGLKDAGENLVGGPASVRESVLILLIDTGIEGFGHRKTLLNPSWKYVACYEAGNVGGMPYSWVQNFAF